LDHRPMPASAAALVVAPAELAVLRRWASAVQAPAGLVRRAKILLLATEGVSNTEIAARLAISRPTVIAWRSRYAREGWAASWPTGLAWAAPRRCGATGALRSWPPPWRRRPSTWV
jgi:Homeodomain-like domain